MSTATITVTLAYTAPGGPVAGASASSSAASAYVPQSEETLDIPAATPAGTVFPVDFGTVDQASVLLIKNKTLLDVGVRLNEKSADAVLVAGTLLINLDNVAGDHLAIEQLAANGDAGTVTYQVFRVSNTQVRAVAHKADYSLENTSVASVRVHNDGKYGLQIPANGFLALGGALPATAAPLSAASIVTTDVTVGVLETFVYGPS